jgi:tetratricopeptide (TPR) repeat protein
VHNAVTWLMEHTDWDFMAVYQEALDHFSHLAMKYHPPKLPDIDQEEFDRYQHIITAAYRFHDMMLERLLELAGPECDVLLLSDHGFESEMGRISELPDIPAAPALEHRKYGVFAAAGPSFHKGTRIYGASLLDIAPGILHYFSLPVGDDMEGKVPAELFRKQEPVSRIPSWEMTGNVPQFMPVDDAPASETLDQLSRLGYIKLPEDNKQEYVRRELLYNRNLSLLEGRYYSKVAEEVRPEWNSSLELRFGLLLAHALQNLHRTEEWAKLISKMRESHPGNAAVIFQSGMLALDQGKHQEALEFFEKIEAAGVISAQLYTEIARAWLVAGNRKRAAEYFDKALNEDPGSTRAITGRAQVMIEEGQSMEALPLLEDSLGLRFFQPQAHYLMGIVSWQEGDSATALKALRICLQQAPRHMAARKLLSELMGTSENSPHDPVIVVSGWPRSGTSMMMRLLEAGGMELYTDSERAADVHNPEGYYEHSAVLRIGQNQEWLPSARGKAVKVVLPLLRYLPASEYYHVIIMKRPLTEVVISQEKMKGANERDIMKNFPFQAAVNLQKEEERMERWFRSQAHMKIHYINLEDCIHRPQDIIRDLSSFLEIDLDLARAMQVPAGNAQNTKLGE